MNIFDMKGFHKKELICREFVLSTYQALKTANPDFPILVRESTNAQARLVARYGALHMCQFCTLQTLLACFIGQEALSDSLQNVCAD